MQQMGKFLLFNFLLWIFCYSSVQAQVITGSCYKSTEENKIFDESITGITITSPMVYIGDPFFTPKWSKGGIKLENNHILNGKIFKYNALMDELFWLREVDYKQIVVKKELVKSFYCTQGDSTILFKKILIRPPYITDSIYSYLQVLAEGKINLYVKRDMKVKNGTNELLSKNIYYIQFQGNKVQSFVPSRRKLLSLLGVKRDQMKQVIKNEKFRVRKEAQLVKAILKFNTSEF
jgi:hypothetical protein